jgi:hypothetical protein
MSPASDRRNRPTACGPWRRNSPSWFLDETCRSQRRPKVAAVTDPSPTGYDWPLMMSVAGFSCAQWPAVFTFEQTPGKNLNKLRRSIKMPPPKATHHARSRYDFPPSITLQRMAKNNDWRWACGHSRLERVLGLHGCRAGNAIHVGRLSWRPHVRMPRAAGFQISPWKRVNSKHRTRAAFASEAARTAR